MSASTLNLGQKEKDCEVLQKLKWVKQIMQSNSLKMMVSEMASLGIRKQWFYPVSNLSQLTLLNLEEIGESKGSL